MATTLTLPTSLPKRRGLLAPLAADEVVGRGVQEVHRDGREELRRPALEEEHVVRVADAEQLLAARDRLVVDGLEFLAAMADLGDAEALALVIQQARRPTSPATSVGSMAGPALKLKIRWDMSA